MMIEKVEQDTGTTILKGARRSPPAVASKSGAVTEHLCKPWRERRSLTRWNTASCADGRGELARAGIGKRGGSSRSMQAEEEAGGSAPIPGGGANKNGSRYTYVEVDRETRKLRHEQTEERARLGLPEPPRHGFTNMDYPSD